jgi:hypothetical protein
MENGECPPDGKVVISFSFSTQENMTRGGHTWGDNLDNNTTNDYETSTGENYDTRIRVKSLRAFIYDAQGCICEITNKTYFELDDLTSEAIEPTRYRFLGEVELTPEVYKRAKNKECKIMLVANSTLGENPADFGDTKFSINDITFPNGFIPMWGVVSKTLTLEPQQDLGTIYLLRSVAKVEVKLSNELVTAGYKIKEVFVNKYALDGYWFPKGWNTVTNTTALAHAGCYYPTTNLSDVAKVFSNNDAKSSSVIYLPEMATTNSDMSIVITDGNNSEYRFDNAIKFANYDGGSATSTTFDVVRNHHYQYTITKVNTGVNLELTCQVQPWTLVEETWDYTDLPAVPDDGHISWSDGNRQGNLVYFDASNPYATFTFGLSAPASATWRVEFVNKKGKQNAFRFTKVVNGVEVGNDANNPNYYMTGNVGEKVTLRVRYTNPNITENNEAYLRILVILSDGRIIQVSELLDEHVITEGGQTTTIKGQEYIMVQTP